MATTDRNDDELLELAERLYAARSGMLEAPKSERRFGIAELYDFFHDPQRTLSPAEQRLLFQDSRLSGAFRLIKAQLRAVDVPMQAAASDGVARTRNFAGGSIRIHPSRVVGQVYVIIQFDQPSEARSTLLLEAAAGSIVKRRLPEADAAGELLMVLSDSVPADQVFLDLLSDPTTTGSLLP